MQERPLTVTPLSWELHKILQKICPIPNHLGRKFAKGMNYPISPLQQRKQNSSTTSSNRTTLHNEAESRSYCCETHEANEAA